MDATILLIRVFLAIVFGVAGVGKLLDLEGSEKALKDFGLPDELAEPLAFMLPGAELLTAFLLLPIATSWYGALASFVLMFVFIVGMLVQMAKGNAPDCHCFGAIHSEPVSKKSVARNAIFAGLALVLIVRGSKGQGLSISDLGNEMLLQLLVGITIIGLFVAIIVFLKRISAQQAQIIRRIEVIELLAGSGDREVARDDAGHPHDSLPVGAVVPDFELPDVNGKVVKFEHLLLNLKPILFFFVSPTCVPCAALLPEIEEWKRELDGRVEFVMISSGTADANVAKFGKDQFGNVLLQKKMEVAELFMAKWTPGAVLVNADGLIASQLAVGDTGIRRLMDSVREIDFSAGKVHVASSAESKLGNEIPEFSLSDIDGRPVSSKDLKGKRTLVAFWSTTCPHCDRMAAQLAEWDRTRGAGEPNLILFSKGDADEHRKIGLESPILIDDDYETAAQFGMLGTPSAVLVDENGRIVSETATGAGNIWALIGRKVAA